MDEPSISYFTNTREGLFILAAHVHVDWVKVQIQANGAVTGEELFYVGYAGALLRVEPFQYTLIVI
jgi:hypothetical protein